MKITEVPIGSRILMIKGDQTIEATVISRDHTGGDIGYTLLAWKQGERPYHSYWNIKNYSKTPRFVGCNQETYNKLKGFDQAIWLSLSKIAEYDLKILKEKTQENSILLSLGGAVLASLLFPSKNETFKNDKRQTT
jgi:hypothetical protein